MAVWYSVRRLPQICTCILNLPVSCPRKLSTVTAFPLSSQQHIIKWLSTPFYTQGTARINLTPHMFGFIAPHTPHPTVSPNYLTTNISSFRHITNPLLAVCKLWLDVCPDANDTTCLACFHWVVRTRKVLGQSMNASF